MAVKIRIIPTASPTKYKLSILFPPLMFYYNNIIKILFCQLFYDENKVFIVTMVSQYLIIQFQTREQHLAELH